MASVFAALGDATRLVLLCRLCDGEAHAISALTRGTGLSRQGITKHLAVLEQAHFVTGTRVGRESRFVLRAEALNEPSHFLARAARQWDEAIGRLRHLVEKP